MYHRQQNTLYPKCGRFSDENFMRYLDLCYVEQIEHLFSIIGCEPIRSFKKIIIINYNARGVKGIASCRCYSNNNNIQN